MGINGRYSVETEWEGNYFGVRVLNMRRMNITAFSTTTKLFSRNNGVRSFRFDLKKIKD